jgi:hypothetical protein
MRAEVAKVGTGTGYIIDLGTNSFVVDGKMKAPYYDFIYILRANNA